MISRVFFLGIDADLHISQALREEPGISPSGDSRLEAAVPQDRSWRALKISHAGNKHGLVPDAAGICDSFGIPQCADKRKNIPQRHLEMNGDEPVPYLEGDVGLAVANLVPNHSDVDLADRREDTIQNLFDVGFDTQ